MKLLFTLSIIALAIVYRYETRGADIAKITESGFYHLILAIAMSVSARRDEKGGRS